MDTGANITSYYEDSFNTTGNVFGILIRTSKVGGVRSVGLFILIIAGIIIGSLGNATVIFVFIRLKKRMTTDVYTVFLASCDLFICLVVMPQFAESMVTNLRIEERRRMMDMKIVSVMYAAYLYTTLALDRVIVIILSRLCRPTIKTAILVCVGGVPVALSVFLIPRLTIKPIVMPQYLIICFIIVALCYITLAIFMGRHFTVVKNLSNQVQPATTSVSYVSEPEHLASKTSNGNSTTTRPNTNNVQSTTSVPSSTLKSDMVKQRQGHVKKVVLVFLLITILFTMAYIPVVLGSYGIIPLPYMAYIHISTFLTNILNPYIYAFSSTKFRNMLQSQLSKYILK